MGVRAWPLPSLLLLGGGLLLFVVSVWSLSLGLFGDVHFRSCDSLKLNLNEERNSTRDGYLVTHGNFIAKEIVPPVLDVEEAYADLGRPGIPRSYGFSSLGMLAGKDILLKDMIKVDLSYFQVLQRSNLFNLLGISHLSRPSVKVYVAQRYTPSGRYSAWYLCLEIHFMNAVRMPT